MDRKIWIPLFCIACSCMLFFIIAGENAGSINELRSCYVNIEDCEVHYKVSGNGRPGI